MRAIILAAGKPAFGEAPISRINIRGQDLLDIQISVLRKTGIENITVVTGYLHEHVSRTDVECRWNSRWESTGSLSSLRCCASLFDGREDLVLMYGDTLCEPWVIEALQEVSSGIAAVCFLDRSNKDRGRFREYAKLHGNVLGGVSAEDVERDVRTVFTGLLLIRRSRAKAVRTYIEEMNAESSYHIGHLVDLMLRRGTDVVPVVIEHGWVELTSHMLYEDALADSLVLESVIQIHTDWTARANKYDQLQWVNDDHLLAAMIQAARVSKPRHVLDVGTGSGKVLLCLRDTLREGEFWGIDTSQAMLDKIPDRDGLTLRLCNVETLDGIPDRHFDLVTARMVFHHVYDVENAIKNIMRVLRPEGVLIVCEGVPPSTRSVRWYTEMFRFKEDRRTLTEGDIIQMYVKGGFRDISTATVTMERASLNNWLNNSGIPQRNIDVIKELHFTAPPEIVEDYNMKFVDGDCLMTWRFAVVTGKNGG